MSKKRRNILSVFTVNDTNDPILGWALQEKLVEQDRKEQEVFVEKMKLK